MSAPFQPGDLIVSRSRPEIGLTVDTCEPHARGGFYVMADHGAMREGGAAENYVLAPKGWRDMSRQPLGSAAGGLAHEYWVQKRENDAADLGYQFALVAGAVAVRVWAQDCAALVNPGYADEVIATANWQIDYARELIAAIGQKEAA